MISKDIYSEVIDIEDSNVEQQKRKYELKLSILAMLNYTPVSGIFAVEALALSEIDKRQDEDKEFYIYQKEVRQGINWFKDDLVLIDPNCEKLPLSDDNTRYILIGKKTKNQKTPAILTYQRQYLIDGIWVDKDIVDVDITKMSLPKNSDEIRYVLKNN